MKVTAVETYVCDVFRTNWVSVKVLTDTGLYGVGESTLEMRDLTVAQAVRELERYVVGRDPHDIEAFWHDAYPFLVIGAVLGVLVSFAHGKIVNHSPKRAESPQQMKIV